MRKREREKREREGDRRQHNKHRLNYYLGKGLEKVSTSRNGSLALGSSNLKELGALELLCVRGEGAVAAHIELDGSRLRGGLLRRRRGSSGCDGRGNIAV